MKAQPYVGITGFKTTQEVIAATHAYSESGFGPHATHAPMFGYLVSAKRLANKDVGGTESPPANQLATLARLAPPHAIPTMHYHTTNKEQLAKEIKELFSIDDLYESHACTAVQLNIDWPPLSQIEHILHTFPEMRIILQLPKHATAGKNIDEITHHAKQYHDLVTYALVDPSGGKGIPFDVNECAALLLALHDAMPHTILGIAGGLSGENVEDRIRTIQERYPAPFCIDAQGKLRTVIEENNTLDILKVQKYLHAAGHALT